MSELIVVNTRPIKQAIPPRKYFDIAHGGVDFLKEFFAMEKMDDVFVPMSEPAKREEAKKSGMEFALTDKLPSDAIYRHIVVRNTRELDSHEKTVEMHYDNGALSFVMKAYDEGRLYEITVDEILAQPAPGHGLEKMLNLMDEEHHMLRNDPDGDQTIYVIRDRLDAIANECQSRLLAYRQWQSDCRDWEIQKGRVTKRGQQFHKEYPKPPCKPADVARNFIRPIEWGVRFGHQGCASIIGDLLLEQTLPISEVDNPGWIDSYTGMVANTDDMVSINLQSENTDPFNLGWSDKDYHEYLDAQGHSEGDDNLTEMSEINDEWDVVEKDFTFQSDTKIDRDEVNAIRSAEFVVSEIADDGSIIDLTRKFGMVYGLLKKKIEWAVPFALGRAKDEDEAQIIAHNELIDSSEYLQLVDGFNALSDQYEPQNLAAAIWPLQHEFGIWEDDFESFKLPKYGNLAHWFELFEEEFVTQFNDASPAWMEEPDEKDLRGFFEDTVKKYVTAEQMPRAKEVNRHPAFIEGALRCALLGSSDQKAVLSAGWEGWRNAVNPEANREFHLAKSAGLDDKAAMKVFWTVVNKTNPVKVGIQSVNATGLTLSGGRKVNWHVATLKLKANELDLDEAGKLRLKGILESKGWGMELSKAL